ncbi:hypothetical protein F7D13_17120 (plasmid) [Methylocystis rosea]|uniref:Uncharacterized protein n=1 Tax=Methylocystis rosea TaxID=173366 RepID=A0ABX6ELY1_9HYPH|nr:hypothetical protein F7D13_17120 [Methylocystis rosea]
MARHSSKKIRVTLNGDGVIGKRGADAVASQDDMELAGRQSWNSRSSGVLRAQSRLFSGEAHRRERPDWDQQIRHGRFCRHIHSAIRDSV